MTYTFYFTWRRLDLVLDAGASVNSSSAAAIMSTFSGNREIGLGSAFKPFHVSDAELARGVDAIKAAIDKHFDGEGDAPTLTTSTYTAQVIQPKA